MRLGWQEYHRRIWQLESYIKVNKIEYLIAVARGGLIATAHLSQAMEIPMGIVVLKTYNKNEQGQYERGLTKHLGEVLDEKFAKKPTLVIDDISDTGQTAEYLETWLKVMKSFTNLHFQYIFEKEKFKNVKPVDVSFPWFRISL